MILRRAAAAAALAAGALALTACSASQQPEPNVRPPAPGVPATVNDVTGIYRTVHQGVLQLRADGDLTLIIPDGVGATSGSFTLSDGTMDLYTVKCGTQPGSYKVQVTGEQKPGKAALVFAPVQDQCEVRRRYLTVDPWIYAVS